MRGTDIVPRIFFVILHTIHNILQKSLQNKKQYVTGNGLGQPWFWLP